MGKTMKNFGFVGPHHRGGSKLIDPDCDAQSHTGQPGGHKGLHGDSVDVAAHHRGGTHGGMAHSFRPPAANMAHGYGHAITQRKGVHRLSGDPGAHMVGQQNRTKGHTHLHARKVKSS